MNNIINFVVGYVIIINLIGISLMWLRVKTDFIKIPEKILNIIYILLSIIGGFVGILAGAEMLEYEDKHKIFKRWIPLLLFLEVCIIVYIVYQKYY